MGAVTYVFFLFVFFFHKDRLSIIQINNNEVPVKAYRSFFLFCFVLFCRDTTVVITDSCNTVIT